MLDLRGLSGSHRHIAFEELKLVGTVACKMCAVKHQRRETSSTWLHPRSGPCRQAWSVLRTVIANSFVAILATMLTLALHIYRHNRAQCPACDRPCAHHRNLLTMGAALRFPGQ